IGQWACDNRLAFLFKDAGYQVSNPALDLRSYHIHRVEFRADRSLSEDYSVPGEKLRHIPVTSTDGFLKRWARLLCGRYQIRPYLHSQALYWGIRAYPLLEPILGPRLVSRMRRGIKSVVNKLRPGTDAS
ncbi:MAG: hypothetical protein GWO24_03060, partial [Akkermansiaceae bacterium]|nr:hypothetical protein [Akkermansiaceae bacterium]